MTAKSHDVVIIGGGVIGLSCAYALALAGASVCVLEQHLPGGAQSTRTGGGVRLSHGSKANVELTRLSLPTWDAFAEEFGVDVRYRQTGHLFLTSKETSKAFLAEQALWHREENVPSVIMGEMEIAGKWPHLETLDFNLGSYCSVGGYLDHHRVILGYQTALLRTGADLDIGVRVEGVIEREGRICGVETSVGPYQAQHVVNAAGASAGVIAAYANMSIPFVSRRHELLIARPDRPVPDEIPWLIDMDRQVHLRPDGQGRCLIGGFLGKDEPTDPTRYTRENTQDWLDAARAAASEAFGLTAPDSPIVDGWAGLYPGTLDYLPVIEELRPGFVTAAGFSGTGLMHAPAVGRIVCDLVQKGATDDIDISQFRSARFEKAAETAERTGF